MILKGNQRAGACDLATHLLNIADNEQIDVVEVTGTIADDLHGAFAEFEALACGTQCKQPLYSLSINPSAPITREQYYVAIERIEKRLGLSGQPRAVIFHIKQGTGREHAHVVWSRIDSVKLRAVQLSHDHMKLRTLARELAAEFGLKLPPGLAEDRDIDRFEKNDMDWSEKAQSEKTGITPKERRAEITAAYRSADGPAAFSAALEERGYFIALGDRRSHVVVDRYGDVHSLSRQIDGVRVKQLREYMEGYLPYTLVEAKARAEEYAQNDKDRHTELIEVRLQETVIAFRRKQAERRLHHYRQSQELRKRHEYERSALIAAQESDARQSVGGRIVAAVLSLFLRIPVLRTVLSPMRRLGFTSIEERHAEERKALERRYLREEQEIARKKKALMKIERRERQLIARRLQRAVRALDHKREMYEITALDISGALQLDIGSTESSGVVLSTSEKERFEKFWEKDLSGIFNDAAQDESGDEDSEEGRAADIAGPDDAEHETDYLLFEFGLSPDFNERAQSEESSPSGEEDGDGFSPPPIKPDNFQGR